MFIFFLRVIWIWVLIMVFIDIFRSHELSGWAKALWFLFVLFVPLIGGLAYLIACGGSMHERGAGRAQQCGGEVRRHGRATAAGCPAQWSQREGGRGELW